MANSHRPLVNRSGFIAQPGNDFEAVKAAMQKIGYRYVPNGLPDVAGVPQGAFYKLFPGESEESDEADVFYLGGGDGKEGEFAPTQMDEPVSFSAQNFAKQDFTEQTNYPTLTAFIADYENAERKHGREMRSAFYDKLTITRIQPPENPPAQESDGTFVTPMHPGFIKLASFETPPDGDALGAALIAEYHPSLEVLNAAVKLSLGELTHLFIDTVGSFEVTHSKYQPPSARVQKIGAPLVAFFNEIVHAFDNPDEGKVSCRKCGWVGELPEIMAPAGTSEFERGKICPKCGHNKFNPVELADTVESQAKKVVENALGQARGQGGLSSYAQEIMRASSAATVYNIIQNFRHEDQLNYAKVAQALDTLEKKLENHQIGTHAFIDQVKVAIQKSGLLPHA